jgi:hypothetical protein
MREAYIFVGMREKLFHEHQLDSFKLQVTDIELHAREILSCCTIDACSEITRSKNSLRVTLVVEAAACTFFPHGLLRPPTAPVFDSLHRSTTRR